MTVKTLTSRNHIRHSIRTPIRKAHVLHKRSIKEIVGCMSAEDAAELKNIIEQSCERIDEDAWKNLH